MSLRGFAARRWVFIGPMLVTVLLWLATPASADTVSSEAGVLLTWVKVAGTSDGVVFNPGVIPYPFGGWNYHSWKVHDSEGDAGYVDAVWDVWSPDLLAYARDGSILFWASTVEPAQAYAGPDFGWAYTQSFLTLELQFVNNTAADGWVDLDVQGSYWLDTTGPTTVADILVHAGVSGKGNTQQVFHDTAQDGEFKSGNYGEDGPKRVRVTLPADTQGLPHDTSTVQVTTTLYAFAYVPLPPAAWGGAGLLSLVALSQALRQSRRKIPST